MVASSKSVSSTSGEDESSDDDSLVLEGVVVRNPDASSSSDDDEEEEEKEDEANENDEETKEKPKKKRKTKEPDEIQVEFTFCDMDDKFFHGIKSLLHNSSTVYQAHSSKLVDLMIENISVGTVVSTADDTEGNVYGFASVLNVTTFQDSSAIQYLKECCLKACPKDRGKELQVALSGETKRPAGFLLHGRMMNLPLEITLTLHQQLVLDMDWAVENAEGGEDERKSLDFGVFVRIAPCQRQGGSLLFRYFEDEIFQTRAEFHYTIDAPKAYSQEEKQLLTIIVLTKTGHREAMRDFERMVKQK